MAPFAIAKNASGVHCLTVSWPAYLDTWKSGALAARIGEAVEALRDCTVCPRDCHVNRLADERKLCRLGRKAKVASWFPHYGEEDCLRGYGGSGTIFFSWCNLKCVFCQNWDTSNEGMGREVTALELGEMMLQLQDQGCHNINLVSPEHVVPQILEALPYAIEGGLRIPIVYNTSGYDSPETLRWMDGIVDIYMPDFKTWDEGTSSRILKARDYPARAREAIRIMHHQVGDLVIEDRLARRGLLVRHLVMPEGLADSEEIFRWLAELSPNTYVNVMDQYYPAGKVRQSPERYPSLNRRVTFSEHHQAVRMARLAGLRRFDVRDPHPAMASRRAVARGS